MTHRSTKRYFIVAALIALLTFFTACLATSNQTSSLVLQDGMAASTLRIEFDMSAKLPVTPEASEQERIDTIIRAFRKLPLEEQEKIGIPLNAPISEGSQLAIELQNAWTRRQLEFKEALNSVMKPAEKMAEFAAFLKNSTDSTDPNEISGALSDLESILGDIDNSRDFHTIGAWPILVNMLAKNRCSEHRSLAALAIGTSVKNSYDFQIWSLERPAVDDNYANKSALEYLIEIVEEESGKHSHSCSQQTSESADILLRRSLYALSAAARGNVDVQDEIIAIKSPGSQIQNNEESSIVQAFQFLSDPCGGYSIEVSRKVWALIDDFLDERYYARVSLMDSPDVSDDIKRQIQEMDLIGDKFCHATWMDNAIHAVEWMLERYKTYNLSALYDEKESQQYELMQTTLSTGEISAVRSTLDSIYSSISSINQQCRITIPSTTDAASELLAGIRSSTKAAKIHAEAFEDMSGTYTYSDNNYYSQ